MLGRRVELIQELWYDGRTRGLNWPLGRRKRIDVPDGIGLGLLSKVGLEKNTNAIKYSAIIIRIELRLTLQGELVPLEHSRRPCLSGNGL